MARLLAAVVFLVLFEHVLFGEPWLWAIGFAVCVMALIAVLDHFFAIGERGRITRRRR